MSFASDAITIKSRFETQWAARRPTVPIFRENVDSTSDVPPDAGTPWVRISVFPGNGDQETMGDAGVGFYRFDGVALIQIYTPRGEGAGLASELADDAAGIFRGKTVNGVNFDAPSATKFPSDGVFYQINLTVPYRVYEVPST